MVRAFLALLTLLPPALAFTPQLFQFTGIPYTEGVRHIHSPEQLVRAHGLAAPGFEIVETWEPMWVRDHVLLRFRYRTWFGEGEGRLFTDRSASSVVWVANAGMTAGLTAKLRVWAVGAQGFGLEVKAAEFGTRGLLETWARPTERPTSEDVARAMLEGSVQAKDANLQEYMRRALWDVAGK